MRVRVALPGDAVAIAGLTRELGYFADEGVIRQRLVHLSGSEGHLVLVVATDHEIFGWAHAHAMETLEAGFRVEIVGLVVSQQCRRRGVGRRLVAAVEQWAGHRGVETLVVRTNTQRAESQQFYPALGFHPTKTQRVYRKLLKQTSISTTEAKPGLFLRSQPATRPRSSTASDAARTHEL